MGKILKIVETFLEESSVFSSKLLVYATVFANTPFKSNLLTARKKYIREPPVFVASLIILQDMFIQSTALDSKSLLILKCWTPA